MIQAALKSAVVPADVVHVIKSRPRVPRWAEKLMGRLDIVLWFVIPLVAATPALASLVSPGMSGTAILSGAINVFFLLITCRIIVAAIVTRQRRASFLVLLSAVLCWGAGVSINAEDGLSAQSFPSMGEAFFLPAYIAFALHILLDSRLLSRHSSERGFPGNYSGTC